MRIFQLPARYDGLLAGVRTTNREGGRPVAVARAAPRG